MICFALVMRKQAGQPLFALGRIREDLCRTKADHTFIFSGCFTALLAVNKGKHGAERNTDVWITTDQIKLFSAFCTVKIKINLSFFCPSQ